MQKSTLFTNRSSGTSTSSNLHSAGFIVYTEKRFLLKERRRKNVVFGIYVKKEKLGDKNTA